MIKPPIFKELELNFEVQHSAAPQTSHLLVLVLETAIKEPILSAFIAVSCCKIVKVLIFIVF